MYIIYLLEIFLFAIHLIKKRISIVLKKDRTGKNLQKKFVV